jgi:predicted CXXCH cytochrome family protein
MPLKRAFSFAVTMTAILVLGAFQVAEAGGMSVLTPADGYKSMGKGVWVIVKDGGEIPVLKIDGADTDQAPIHGGDGIYHFRVDKLANKGTRLEVSHDQGTVALTVYGPGSKSQGHDSFHSGNLETCGECHERGNKGCRECHTFGGHKHAGKIKCESCHDEDGKVVDDIAPACVSCHRDYAGNRHPHLRHPVKSANDPMRPGKRFDCASCHDPHAPNCLSDLSKKELRKWCRGCHSQR